MQAQQVSPATDRTRNRQADSPLPTDKYAEFNGYITKTQKDAPAHMSAIEFKNQWYFFYQRGDVNDGTFHRRSSCYEKMAFNQDGTIKPIEYTLDKGVVVNEPVTPIK